MDDINSEFKEGGVIFMGVEEEDDLVIDDIDFEMLFISNTTEGITEDTGGRGEFKCRVEIRKFKGGDIRGGVFRIDKDRV